ncbi:MAG: AEC family transporter [Ethanoligenens sp.]
MAFITVLTQVLMVFALMAVGVLSNRLHFLHDDAARDITKILIYFVSPCVILRAFDQPFSRARASGLLVSFGGVVALFVLSIIAARLIFRPRMIPDADRRRVLEFGTVYSNAGFMGVPLLQAVMGAQGIFYGTPYLAVFNLFCWTHGSSLYEGKPDRKTAWKILCNPNIIAIAAGLAMFLCAVRLPSLVSIGIGYLYNLNTPLSMIVIGNSLARLHPRTLLADRSIWPGVLMRNLSIPLAAFVVFRFTGLPRAVWMPTILLSACPVAGYCVLFAGVHGKDTAFPTRMMALSTLLSVVTIPLVVGLAAL